ncbi:MAG: PspC domain-containing protein [Clostridia bacterium]|nr:PspC domain-containing protein [Clostridia bacterium]
MTQKKLYRSNTDKKISGVCGGIAEYIGMDSTIVRLLLVAFVLMGGAGVLAYIVCSFVIPERPENDGFDNNFNNGGNI